MSFYNILTVKGQTLIDISMEEYGHIDGAFYLLEDNKGIVTSLTEELAPGIVLKLRTTPDVDDLKKLAYVRKGKELQSIKVIEKQIWQQFEGTLNFLPGTSFQTLRMNHVGQVKNIEKINIASLDISISEGTSIDYDNAASPFFTRQIALPVEIPFAHERGDVVSFTITKTNEALPASITIKGDIYPQSKVIEDLPRGNDGYLLVLNYVDQTISVIDVLLCKPSNMVDGNWVVNPVVALLSPPAAGAGITWERMIYNPRENNFRIWARNRQTVLYLNEANPANSQFYNVAKTILNGVSNEPYNAIASGNLNGGCFVPGSTSASDSFVFGYTGGELVWFTSEYDFYQRSVWVRTPGLVGARVNYVPEVDKVFATEGKFVSIQNPRSYAAEGMVVIPNAGDVKFDKKRGRLRIQGENRVWELSVKTWQYYTTAQSQVTSGVYGGFCFTNNGKIFTGSNTSNTVWRGAVGNDDVITSIAISRTPGTNEIGTRDLVYSPKANLVFAQGMRNGNQVTGVNFIHVYDPETDLYVGRVQVGNLDARSASNLSNCQMCLNFYNP